VGGHRQHPEEGIIHAWLDGALSPAESREIEEHVASCAECEARVAEARGMIAGASRIVSHLDVVPGKVIPAAAPKVKSKSWLRSPWPMAIAATLVIGIGFVASRDHVVPSVSEGPASPPRFDTQPAPSTQPAASELTPVRKQVPRSAPDDKQLSPQLPPPAATAQRSARVAAPGPAPRTLDAQKQVAAAEQAREDNRLAEVVATGATNAKSAAAGAARSARPPAAAPAPAAALGMFAAADRAVDSAMYAGCYELLRPMMTRVETTNRFTLPDRFALVGEPAPVPRLFGIRRVDADGNRGELLAGAGWKVERNRAVVVDEDGRVVMTIAKPDSATLSASPAARVLSCK
jgi:anti-sigma factor RsiW